MKKLLTLATITLSSTFAQAQTWETKPFNVNAQKLPVNFVGHYEANVFDALKSRQVSKGQFESTSEFESRQSKVNSKVLFGQVYSWSPIAITSRPDNFSYNADDQTLKASFDFRENSNNNLEKETSRYSRHKGAYDSLYGTVYTETFYNSGFQIIKPNWFIFNDISKWDDVYRFTFVSSVDKTKAKRLQKKIMAAYIGYLTSPYTNEGLNFKGPSYPDGLYSRTDKFFYICMRLKAIWVYDSSTGEILKKVAL